MTQFWPYHTKNAGSVKLQTFLSKLDIKAFHNCSPILKSDIKKELFETTLQSIVFCQQLTSQSKYYINFLLFRCYTFSPLKIQINKTRGSFNRFVTHVLKITLKKNQSLCKLQLPLFGLIRMMARTQKRRRKRNFMYNSTGIGVCFWIYASICLQRRTKSWMINYIGFFLKKHILSLNRNKLLSLSRLQSLHQYCSPSW